MMVEGGVVGLVEAWRCRSDKVRFRSRGDGSRRLLLFGTLFLLLEKMISCR